MAHETPTPHAWFHQAKSYAERALRSLDDTTNSPKAKVCLVMAQVENLKTLLDSAKSVALAPSSSEFQTLGAQVQFMEFTIEDFGSRGDDAIPVVLEGLANSMRGVLLHCDTAFDSVRLPIARPAAA